MNTANRTAPSAQSDANRAAWSALDDEANPTFTFSLAHSAILAAAARGELDLMRLAREELANRGLDQDGVWVGFKRANELCAAALVKKAAK